MRKRVEQILHKDIQMANYMEKKSDILEMKIKIPQRYYHTYPQMAGCE